MPRRYTSFTSLGKTLHDVSNLPLAGASALRGGANVTLVQPDKPIARLQTLLPCCKLL